MALRKCKDIRWCSIHFIGVLLLIGALYFIFLYAYIIQFSPSWQLTILIIVNALFFMAIWSLLTVFLVDPGQVPSAWGLYTQRCPKQEYRKYCVPCCNFKPERCHHCSVCQKCVLNMDHHCPWVNNCVGFYNRKFFILFLFYINLTLAAVTIAEGVLLYDDMKKMISEHYSDIFTVLRLIGFISCLGLLLVLVSFFISHMSMILSNTTTIEDIIRMKQNYNSPLTYNYNINNYDNFTQVFGTNQFFWLLPVSCSNSGPVGNGVIWPRNYFSIVNETKQSESLQ